MDKTHDRFICLFYNKFKHDLIVPTFAFSEESQRNEECCEQQKLRVFS